MELIEQIKIGNTLDYFGENVVVKSIEHQPCGYYIKAGIINGFVYNVAESFKGVRISVDILKEIGFTYNDYYDNYYIKGHDYEYHSIKYIDGKWIYNLDKSDAGCYYCCELEFLHEIENLYYSLNKIKLNKKATTLK